MRTLARISMLTVAVAVLTSLTAAATATSPKLPALPQSSLFTPSGKMTPLRTRITYRASQFPLAVRLTPPSPGWDGVQWKSGDQYFRGGKPPNFGWVHAGRGPATGIPQGLISIM